MILCAALFSEIEIKATLFQMEKNKAARPDKIPIGFYQSCWDIIKDDIIQFFLMIFIKTELISVELIMASSLFYQKSKKPAKSSSLGLYGCELSL